MHQANSALTSTPQSAVVLLEPTNRQQLDVERSELLTITLPDDIASAREYEELARDLERVDGFIKIAKPAFDEVCADAHKTWKSATELRALFFERLEAFSTGGRRLLGRWKTKQDEIRRAEERRLAEEERQRQLARQKEEAKQLEKQGQKDLAAAVKNTPIAAPVVNLPSAVPTVQGLTYRTVWKWRIAGCSDIYGGRKDKDARKRAAKLIDRQFVDIDDAAITAYVNNQRSAAKLAGIEVYSEQEPVRR